MALIILDRDGVINEDSPHYIRTLAQWRPIPGSIDAIARLFHAGFQIVVATNQSGLGRGLFDLDDLQAMHAHLYDLVAEQGAELAGIFYCPHAPEDNCICRKPKPGLFDAISAELMTSLTNAPVVGDSLRDIQAGIQRGCEPFLVRTGKGRETERKLLENPELFPHKLQIFDTLSDLADYLVGEQPAPDADRP